MPNPGTYIAAVFFCALSYFCIIAGITTLVVFVKYPSKTATDIFILCTALSILTWLISYFKRRKAFCPLCKGTPLVNSGALAHSRSVRVFPFNHGVTATLSIIATHKFCCMYCGTGFDLLKTPSHMRSDKLPDDQNENSANNS